MVLVGSLLGGLATPRPFSRRIRGKEQRQVDVGVDGAQDRRFGLELAQLRLDGG